MLFILTPFSHGNELMLGGGGGLQWLLSSFPQGDYCGEVQLYLKILWRSQIILYKITLT